MILHPTKLQGVFEVEPTLHADERGYFYRNFAAEEAAKVGHSHADRTYQPGIQQELRDCKEITACTVDRRVVRCARGGGHPAGKACRAGARAHGAIAPGVGGD